ncbi:TraI domain-containing protein, partial [Thiolapillus sp.]|uniref:TraI domain-containing protein n=2 Tax=Thiolapillus sp. TaxID=2017437 RepID=UPI003AF40C06
LQQPGFSPAQNNAIKQRWPYAAMVAGLCHDLAKPFADFEVTSKDTRKVWDPFSETLLGWAQREKIDRYRYTWNKGRYGKHEQMAGGLIHHVLTPEFLSWLREAGSTVTYPMFQVIAYGSASPKRNPLRAVIMDADQRSTITDVHRWQEARKEIGMKVKMERYLLNIIKEQILSDEWTVNEVDSIVFVVDGDVFLEWKEAAAFLIYKLDELELNGLPSTPAAIADLLIKTDITMQNLSNPNRPRRLWDISIPVTSRDGTEIKVTKTALRFVSPDYILDHYYDSLPGATILKTPTDANEDADLISTEPARQNTADTEASAAGDTENTPVSEEPQAQKTPPRHNRKSKAVGNNDVAFGRPSETASPGTANNKAFALAAELDKDTSTNESQNHANGRRNKAQNNEGEGKKASAPGTNSEPGKNHLPFGGHGVPPASKSSKGRAKNKAPSQKKAHPNLEKEFLARLRRTKQIQTRIRQDASGALYLVYPDAFLGNLSKQDLKNLFVQTGLVQETDNPELYLLRDDLAKQIVPMLEHNGQKKAEGRAETTLFPSQVGRKASRKPKKAKAASNNPPSDTKNPFTHN